MSGCQISGGKRRCKEASASARGFWQRRADIIALQVPTQIHQPSNILLKSQHWTFSRAHRTGMLGRFIQTSSRSASDTSVAEAACGAVGALCLRHPENSHRLLISLPCRIELECNASNPISCIEPQLHRFAQTPGALAALRECVVVHRLRAFHHEV